MLKKKLLSLLLVLALGVTLLPVQAAEEETPEAILAAMSAEEKISQMVMPAFRWYPDENGVRQNVTELTADAAAMLERHGFAGVALFSQNTAVTEKAVKLVDDMQKANAKAEGRTQLLMAIDQEGGSVTRLGQGTQMPGNMALGAANDAALTAEAATVIGKEIMSMGVNFNFAPVLDVNSNPGNPVIGIRSFSDDPRLAAEQGVSYMKALQSTGAISTLKHFPGHGDTDTDSHTGLPMIDKSYAELKENELIPFRAAIDAGAEAVMTAHIQHPQIESGTYVSKSTGENIYLPDTLSKTILTDILRGDMGFEGVIITDAMNMDAIAAHFGPIDAAKMAIEAGVNILLTPVDTSTPEGLAALDDYIETLSRCLEEGEISAERVNDSVLRILKLKAAHGLTGPYQGIDASASAIVGSREHHEIEWGIAKKAVTLVKNKGDLLPLTGENQKIAVLTAYNNEVLSMQYAVNRLKDEGKLAAGTEVNVASIQGKSAEEALALAAGADHVVVITEQGSAAALRNDNAKKVDALIEGVHARGGSFTLLSCQLPYDAARYQEADAIVLAWSAKGMSEDPRVKDGAVAQYGPNMPAALYLILSPDETPVGKLPVNIPELTEEYTYSDEILYPRGWGLRYGSRPVPAELLSRAGNSLTFSGTPGQEYIIVECDGEPDWSAAVEPNAEGKVVFSDLAYGAAYDVFTRVKNSDGRVAMTRGIATELLRYGLTADSYLVGTTLTVDAEPAGDYIYRWCYDQGDGTYRLIRDATEEASYLLGVEDAGKTLGVWISTRSYAALGEIKGIGPVIAAPLIIMFDSTSVAVSGVAGQEYTIAPTGAGPDWSSALAPDENGDVRFSNLTPATSYEVWTRIKGSDAEGVKEKVVTSLNGIDIQPVGNYTVGTTLTAKPDPETEGLRYQWYYVNEKAATEVLTEIPGAEAQSYTISAYDVGRSLTVRAYADGAETDMAQAVGPVAAVPGAPELLIAGTHMAYVEGVAGNEYALAEKGASPDWTDAREPEYGAVLFDDLKAATEYVVYTRAKGAAEVFSTPFVTTPGDLGVDCEDYIPGNTVRIVSEESADCEYRWYHDIAIELDEDQVFHSLTPIEGARGDTYTIRDEDAGWRLAFRAFRGTQFLEEYDNLGPVRRVTLRSPVKPVLAGQMGDEIFIRGVSGQEYALAEGDGEPDWDTAMRPEGETLRFSGLRPAEVYRVWTRIAETGSDMAGPADYLEVTATLSSTGLDAAGYLPGCVLTVLPEPEDAAGLSYQWCRVAKAPLVGEYEGLELTYTTPIAGATGKSYVLTEADVGEVLAVKILKNGVEVGGVSEIGPVVSEAVVEFDADGGSDVPSQTGIPYGGKVSKPADPVRTGYTFLGWYDDEKPWNFDTDTVKTDYLVLTAKWRSNQSQPVQPVSPVQTSSGSASTGGSSGTSYMGINAAVSTPAGGGSGSNAPASRYTDVAAEAWYRAAVEYCSEKGWFYGVGDGRFAPEASMTREMLATVLYRAAGEPKAAGENPFRDTAAGAWYSDAVAWAAEKGVVDGMGDGLFGLGEPVTREQLAVMLYRFARLMGKDVSTAGDLSRFADAPSDWAAEAMAWAAGAGVLSGRTNGNLSPKDAATRAEVAQMLASYDAAK